MKALLEAIKRVKSEPSTKDHTKEAKDKIDRAPSLDSSEIESEHLAGPSEQDPGRVEEILSMSDEEKARLLEDLISTHQGREPIGLKEKASSKMRDDLEKFKKV